MDQTPPREPAIAFRFKSDRFGFRSNVLNDRGGFAHEVVAAIDHWEKAVEALFGDVAGALQQAGEARILPQYPAWKQVSEWRDSVRGELSALSLETDALELRTQKTV